MEKRRSIKNRLVKNFMFLIVITVVFLELLVIGGIRHYYYKNIEELLTNQLNFSVEYLLKYLDHTSIEDIVMNDIDLFWSQTRAQVQLYNKNGDLLLDSSGVDFSHGEISSDLSRALLGERGVRIWQEPSYGGEVISIAQPIIHQGEQLAVLRFTSSMEETKNIVTSISISIFMLGLVVIVISGILSIFLARDIVGPIEEVTRLAKEMASGNLKARSNLSLDDEVGQLSQILTYMSSEILKREEVKNDFISSISHELKTPLTSIKGWAITLQGEEDIKGNEIIGEGLAIIENESDRLSEMLENLLDFSRFLSGDIILKKELVNMKDLLISTYNQILALAEINNVDLELDVEELGQAWVDKNRIRQVLLNLLDNALKFVDQDPKILIRARKSQSLILIEIIDNGIGITREDLPYITDKFYKGKSSKSNAGIGLSVVKEIIDLHKGSLYIESSPGQGSKISMEIPVEEIS